MTMETEYDKIRFQDESNALGLIDFSSENDVLFLDASDVLQSTQPLEQWNELSDLDFMGSTSIDAGIVESSDQVENFPDLIKSPEPEREVVRKGKCNMRKSLAWDNAFFTNAGVLDPEELSTMINGAEKCEKQPLPQIAEDVRESADSISTLGSDTLTMDNLEVGFFQDIRASIQKSAPKQVDHVAKNQVKPKTALKKPNAIPKVLPKQNIQPQVDHVAKNQVKPKTALKKPNTIQKVLPKQNLQPQVAMKEMTQDSQIAKPTARSRVLTTTTAKATRIISSRNPISTATGKRDSLGAVQGIKGEKDKPRTGASGIKGAEAVKGPASSARRVLPKPASSSKSSSLSSSMRKSELSRLSSDSSGSLPPVHATISPLKAAKRKLDNRLVKSPSDSTLKTTSRTVLRDRTSTSNSARLMSFRKSSSMSPSSSISVRSSASSTSASGTNQRSNKSRNSFDTSSCKSLDSGNLPLNLDHNLDQRFDGHEDGGLVTNSQQTTECSTLTGTLSHPAYAKPSGLRRPSPSIGFFDGTKTVKTPNGSLQRGGVPLPLAKVGAVARCPNQETGLKPYTKKSRPTPLPDVTSQCPDNIATDLKGSCATSILEDLETSRQGDKVVARDAEIRPTHSECDENLHKKPNTKKSHPTPLPEVTTQYLDNMSTDLKGSCATFILEDLETSRQGNKGARDAEIRPTHSECDENLQPSGQDDKFAVAVNELKVCSSALSQCNQNENSGLEKQAVESNRDFGLASSNICQLGGHSDEQEAAPIFPLKTSNNCRDPLAEIKVACSQDNFIEPLP